MKKCFLIPLVSLVWLSVPIGMHGQSLDLYGGRTDINCTNATGHFIMSKVSNRWWFCTPLGHVFQAMGISVTGPQPSKQDCAGTSLTAMWNTKYGGATTYYQNSLLTRVLSWGFNGLGTETFALGGWEASLTVKVPSLYTNSPLIAAAGNSNNNLTEPVKSAVTGFNLAQWGVFGNASYDVFDTKFGTEIAAELTNAVANNVDGLKQVVQNNSYILGMNTDDTDWFVGFGGGPEIANGIYTGNLGLLWAVTSPVQTLGTCIQCNGNTTPQSTTAYYLYQDTVMHGKANATNPAHGTCSYTAPCSVRDYLYDEYSGSISALNTAWGSSYTTFGSTGTQVTGESIGTGDGSTVTFTHTLANLTAAPFSLQFSVGGVPMGGDRPWFRYSGTVNTGTLLGVPTTVTISAASQSGSNTTYTYKLKGIGNVVYPSESIVITGMGDAVNNGTFIVTAIGSSPCASACTFTVVNASGVNASSQTGTGTMSQPVAYASSTVNYSTGAISITFNSAPLNGAAIVVSYVYGGWMSGGTGLMDESGGGSWTGTNIWCIEGANPSYSADFACNGMGGHFLPVNNANVNFGADLDGWSAHYSAQYHKTVKQAMTAAGSNVPYWGVSSFGATGASASRFVLQGAAPWVDLEIMELAYYAPTTTGAPILPGPSPTLADTLKYETQYAGDIPIMNELFLPAHVGSPEACTVAQGVDNEMPDQATRGQQYYNTINYMNTTPGFNNDYQYIGLNQWTYRDFQGDNWGVVSEQDNAYDGVEDVVATVSCEMNYTIMGGTCGAEPQGVLGLAANPSNGNTITINGTTVTFVTGTPVGNQVQIAGSTSATFTNLLTFLQGSADPQISLYTYTANGNSLGILGSSNLTLTQNCSVCHSGAAVAGNWGNSINETQGIKAANNIWLNIPGPNTASGTFTGISKLRGGSSIK